jgi:hypothetical protein
MSRDRQVPRRSAPPIPPIQARDVALGIAVVGVRGAVAGARLLILPARIATRTLLPDRTARRLASEGSASRLRVRAQLTTTGGELLAAPEIDALGRALADHRVIERVARPTLAAPEVETTLASVLEEERTRRLVEQALDSHLAAQVTDHLLQSPELERAVEQIASSAAVRAALANQSTSLAGELVAGLRRRAEHLDDAAERTARRWFRRPLRSNPA